MSRSAKSAHFCRGGGANLTMTDKNADDRQHFDEDDLIEHLVPDLDHPDVLPISGVFIGKGSTAETIRLYTTIQLNQYFQVPRDKVLGVKRFASGVVVIWVPADLRVQLLHSDTLSGDFLKGSIQAEAGSRLGGVRRLFAPAQNGGGGGFSRSPFCQTDVVDPGNPICTLSPGCGQPTPTGCSC